MSAKNSSSSSKVCSFCNLAENNELEYGKIYEHNGIVTHYYCLLLSSNMEQKGNDDEGILGFLTEDIQKELRRGKRLACSYCKKIGATLGCCNVKCKRIFHFPCGLKAGSLHQFFGEFRSYCVNHRPKQKIEDQILKQIGSEDNVVCYICYDKVNTNDFVKTMWAPCCKKDAWFHRNCVQQLALSAGYFFKCPLCNNKKDFQKAMLEYGIFVPSQDASWELVPNAFEELLYRHDQCDAPKCLCPKGRKHTSNNAKWELALCRTCGSQGIHMACGQLKWANPVWECDECTSILSNANNNKQHSRLDNSSAIGSYNQNKDSDSDLDSNSDLNSDLDSDTDISVGTDFPVPSSLPKSSSISSLDSILDIRLRPGPRSFKLQQQINLGKWLDLTNTGEKNVTTEVSPKNTNESLSKNNDEKKEPSTSKENIPQQEIKEDSSQKEKQSSSKSDEKPIRNEMDVITIESDDDDVELIALKQKTNVPLLLIQQPTQSGSSYVSPLKQVTLLNATENSVISESQTATIDLLKTDNINIPKTTASESEASNKSESTILDQISIATPQESTLDLIALSSNDLEETDVADTNETSVMNIKITNVTSLPPEVFESVPDVCDDTTFHTNTTDTSSLFANKTLEQLVTHVSSTKRCINEANGVTDNCKKIKRNGFDERLHEMNNPFISVIVTNNKNSTNSTQNDAKNNTNINNINNSNNTNRQQNNNISASKSNEIEKNDKNPKCTSETYTNKLNNNQKSNLSTQYISLHKNDVNQIKAHLERNSVSINIQQSNESSVAQRNTTEFVSLTKNNQLFVQLPSIGGYYVHQIPNSSFRISQKARRTEKTNMYAIPSSSIILPHMTDNITVLSNQTLLVNNQPIMTSVTTPILNNTQTTVINQETVLNGNVSVTPNIGNNSSNKSYCDGDAGTRPAETDSSSRKKDNPSNDSYRSMVGKQSIGRQSSTTTRNVFPQVTNNHNTCHQPRLIPRYVNLHDLKFQVSASNNIQMTLYDTFSVNISMKNPKESRAGAAASREPKESSTPFREASCSSDYVDNIPTERQRSDKFFRSLKNDTYSSDKNTCAKCTRDDAKENLDPIRTKMLSHSGTDNVNSTNNVDNTVTINNHIYNENDSEMRLVSSDTNLGILNRTICNTNVDSVTDDVTNNCNQGTRVNLEGVQQHKQASMRNAIPVPAREERSGARLFFKEPNRIVHSVDFDLNIANKNKNVEKVSQNDIVPTSQREGDRIGNDHTDDSPTLRNGYKQLDSTNVMKPKINNRNIARVSRFNEHSILNKQIDASDSKKFIQCIAFQENTVCYNNETRTKNNDEFCLKVSVDLSKIQNLIDSKPELFENRKHDQRRTSPKLPDLDDYARQQEKYCDIENSDSINNCLPKNRELQKSNYACNIERMQRDVFSGANTFLRYQKSNQGVKYFNKNLLDR